MVVPHLNTKADFMGTQADPCVAVLENFTLDFMRTGPKEAQLATRFHGNCCFVKSLDMDLIWMLINLDELGLWNLICKPLVLMVVWMVILIILGHINVGISLYGCWHF